MLNIRRLSRFRKDYKRCLKRGYEVNKLHSVLETLMQSRNLDARYRNHSLHGEYEDCRECHIEPDWLLIYQVTETELVLIRTGTHADLFE